MRLRLAGVLCAVAGLAAGGAAEARKPRAMGAGSAPSWVREAAKVEVAGDLSAESSVLLHDELVVEPLAAGGVRRTRRQAWRVLRPEGLASAGRLGFTYSEDDRVEEATGWNLLPDGTLRVPDPKDDVDDFAWSLGGSLVDDTRYRGVRAPACRVGSVVGWEWSVVHWLDTGAVVEGYGSESRPVGRCRLELRLPPGWSFEDLPQRADAFTRTETESGVVWSSPGVARPPQVEHALPAEERLPRIALRWFSPDDARGFRSWDAVAAWYRELADPTLGEPGESAALAERLKPAAPDRLEESLRAAFLFASRDVRYVSVQMGIGGYKPATPARTCSKRYGDCKAKSFLMRSVVSRWGLESFPVLVRTADVGDVLPEVPTPGQFNHCIVAVKLPEGVGEEAWNVLEVEGLGRLAFLDPTTVALGPWQLREDDQGTLGLLVTPEAGRLVELPVQPPESSESHWDMTLALDAAGRVAEGELRWTATGTRAGDLRRALATWSDEQLRRFHESFASELAPGSVLGEHELTGVDEPEGPVVLRLTFSGGRAAQAAAGLLFVDAAPSVTPLNADAFGEGARDEPLRLGLPEQLRIDYRVRAPEGYAPEELPAAFEIQTAWFDARGEWTPMEDGYAFRGLGRQVATEVPAADYESFREPLRRAASLSGEGVVLAPRSP